MPTLPSDNDDIERELYSLGLSDDDPSIHSSLVEGHNPGTRGGIFPVSPALSAISGLSSLPPQAPRSHSAPAPLYPMHTTHGGHHNVFPVHDPSAVHYPGYVYPQDFLTLPRDPTPSTASFFLTHNPVVRDDIPHYPQSHAQKYPWQYSYEDQFMSPYSLYDSDISPPPNIYYRPPPLSHQQLMVAKIEAALRRLQRGLQDSYIFADGRDSPPPPQPSSPHLRDPPPSPVPPHNNESPPGPSDKPPRRSQDRSRFGSQTTGVIQRPHTSHGFHRHTHHHHYHTHHQSRQRQHPPLRKHRSQPEQYRPDYPGVPTELITLRPTILLKDSVIQPIQIGSQQLIDIGSHLPSITQQINIGSHLPTQIGPQQLTNIGLQQPTIIEPQQPIYIGPQQPTRIVCSMNASSLSRRLGFKPIQEPEILVHEVTGTVHGIDVHGEGRESEIRMESSEQVDGVIVGSSTTSTTEMIMTTTSQISDHDRKLPSKLQTFQVEVEVQQAMTECQPLLASTEARVTVSMVGPSSLNQDVRLQPVQQTQQHIEQEELMILREQRQYQEQQLQQLQLMQQKLQDQLCPTQDPLAEKLQYLMEKDPEFYQEYQSFQRGRLHSFHHPHRHRHGHHQHETHHQHRHHHHVAKQPSQGDKGRFPLRRAKSARRTAGSTSLMDDSNDKVKVRKKFCLKFIGSNREFIGSK